jgi:hypothetical protein
MVGPQETAVRERRPKCYARRDAWNKLRQAALHHDNVVGRQVLRRLGFRVVDKSIPYVRLRWTPIQIPAPSSKDS